MMGINTSTNDFLQKVTSLINESGLPPVNVRLALQVVERMVADAERQAIEQEKAKEAKETAEVKDGGNS